MIPTHAPIMSEHDPRIAPALSTAVVLELPRDPWLEVERRKLARLRAMLDDAKRARHTASSHTARLDASRTEDRLTHEIRVAEREVRWLSR